MKRNSTNLPIDYLDPDVAYFLGLVTARGKLAEVGGVKRISIEFPFRNLRVQGIKKKIVQKDQIILSLRKARDRVNELADVNVREEEREHGVYLILETMKNTIFWRNIKTLMRGKTSHYEFDIPSEIFGADEQVQKEFLRGYADVAGSARWANRNRWGKCRVYLDILNPNWKLPRQLCWLIQDCLKIPVDTITYGHPNLRDPNLKEYKAGRKDAWAREHQIKIFADEFEKVGFYMSHKQEVLEELAVYNKDQKFDPGKFCSPPKRLTGKARPSHPGERSDKLPSELCGKHYDSYWQICVDLGCRRYANFMSCQTKLQKQVRKKKPSKKK